MGGRSSVEGGWVVCVDVGHVTQTFVFFFFNDTATTEIYTLSLHDALPIWAKPFSHKMESLTTA